MTDLARMKIFMNFEEACEPASEGDFAHQCFLSFQFLFQFALLASMFQLKNVAKGVYISI